MSRVNSHSCKNSPLSHMMGSRKTSGNIIFIDSRMDLTDFGKTVENYSYFNTREILQYRETRIYREKSLRNQPVSPYFKRNSSKNLKKLFIQSKMADNLLLLHFYYSIMAMTSFRVGTYFWSTVTQLYISDSQTIYRNLSYSSNIHFLLIIWF